MQGKPPISPPLVDPKTRLIRARKTVLSGVGLIIGGFFVMGLPILLRTGSLNKYIVVVGFLSVCLGASFIIHGGWDWLRERRR